MKNQKEQEVYSILDIKSGIYSRPMFVLKKGMMLREFQDIANDKNHPIGKHPEDYCLYYIGQYDDEKGVLIPADKHASLGKAVDYLKE